ncbi:unnamed protein product [Lepeophtheirus salmonis]|uniref:Metalloendopeptidase n=1 Tax=Lepeophtheirus salmonis TaxID=72036 RepID=A0A7R8H7Z6_LEPSM|nr:unnamed protein product [Lepeophtheirus salmonis]CAF2930067.1 unnamed protein product [Lepeophtheirus salmonis]
MILIYILVLFQLISKGHALIQCGARDPNEHVESRNLMSGMGSRWPNSTTYLNIVNNKPEYECFTTIGYSTQREKFLHLRFPQCLQFGIIVHELLHALGFDHEHNRYDRDEYIRIHWQNLMRGGISNFYKSKKKGDFSVMPICNIQSSMDLANCYNGYSFETYGYAYDYGSIMHYGRTSNGYHGQTTITPINDENQELGQLRGMSELDIKKLMAAYCGGRTLEESCLDSNEGCPHWTGHCNTTSYIRDMCEKSCKACQVGEFKLPRPMMDQNRAIMERSISKMILIYILVLFQLISKGHALIQCGARDPNEHVESRNLMSGMGSRWPNSTVPYRIGNGLIHYSSMIKSAMEHIESNSCVKFVQQSKQKTYLNIVNNKPEYECFTTIGYSTQRENFLHLRFPQCLQFGIIVHELLHALGFDHEHNRYDRDEYIRIHWQNLMRANCYNGYSFETYGYAYDYGSIMHYGRTSNGYHGQTTITPINDENQELGQLRGMSELDIKKLMAAYCGGRTLEESCLDSNEGCPHWTGHCNTTSYIRDMCEKSCKACQVGEFKLPRP